MPISIRKGTGPIDKDVPCNICYAKEQTYILKFRGKDSPGSTSIYLCKKCLLKLNKVVSEVEK